MQRADELGSSSVIFQAKTIDLCNNPKTKEPKLVAARRIISEWPALDEEQANFTSGVDAMFAGLEAAFAESGDAASSTSANVDVSSSSDAADEESADALEGPKLLQNAGIEAGHADASHDEL